MVNNLEKGTRGELIARTYLQEKGYKILATNYRKKQGEIDIIALDEDTLVFIEVKTRTGINFGYGFEAVNRKKQDRIIKSSYIFIKENNYYDYQLRYDIIEIYLTEKIKVNHIENAFC
ncbi:MAG: YraN family protein [Tissierellia bacterium]|nr:YraN family protein [Tissierellia bacterium]